MTREQAIKVAKDMAYGLGLPAMFIVPHKGGFRPSQHPEPGSERIEPDEGATPQGLGAHGHFQAAAAARP